MNITRECECSTWLCTELDKNRRIKQLKDYPQLNFVDCVAVNECDIFRHRLLNKAGVKTREINEKPE